jgi:hypothetical protein
MKRKQIILSNILSLFIFANSLLAAENISVLKEIIMKGEYGREANQVGKRFMEGNNVLFVLPSAIAIDMKGNIYLADYVNNRIKEYDGEGKLLFTIERNIEKEDRELILDIAIDGSDNLYAASRISRESYPAKPQKLKIDKYSQDGRFVQSILDYKEDYEEKGLLSCAIMINRMTVDVFGNIYLQCWDELIKFNNAGIIEKRWAIEYKTYTAIFLLDEIGNLYLFKNIKNIEKYNSKGKLIARGKCGELHSFFENGNCLIPEFVDKKGSFYWFEKRGTVVVKADKRGKRQGEYVIKDFQFNVYKNTVKFDYSGNLYILEGSKDKFWVEKIRFN